MEERQLAEYIMNVMGNALVHVDDFTLGGGIIADRYVQILAKAEYNLVDYNNFIEAIRHYVVCAWYEDGECKYLLSDYRF